MRVLLITKAHRFVNPTRELFLASLGPEFIVVGPGYGPVRQTVADYVRDLGPFDGCVLDGHVYLGKSGPAGVYAWPDADATTFADLFDHFPRLVVLNLLDDFHGSTPEQFVALFDPRVFVLSAAIGAETLRFERFLAARRETWFQPAFEALPRRIPPSYILFPASLGDDEFAAPDRRPRRDEVAILGVQYYVRRRVAELLRDRGVRVVTGDDWRFRLVRASVGRTGRLAGLYRRMFINALDRAKVGVTCSGTVGYPIRKFFEIPARRAALVAEFFDNSEALGFRTGENCVALHEEDASDAPGIIRRLLADDRERERIANAGYDLIWSRHRMRHRVEQLLDVTRAMATDDLITARWEDGRLRLVLRSTQPAAQPVHARADGR